MKKSSMFQIILLAVFGALAAAGVVIFAVATSSSSAKTLGPLTIWGTFDGPTMTSVIQDIAQSQSDLSQVTYKVHDQSTYQNDLTQALANGQGPDLFIVRQDYAFEDTGEIAAIPYSSLSQSQFTNTFIEGASPFLGTSGVEALPMVVDPLVLFWNKDMLAAAGFSQPPQYWDQIYGMATAITTKDDSGTVIKSAIALGTYDNIDDAKDILALLILQTPGGAITKLDGSGNLISAIGSSDSQSQNEQNIESALRFYTEFSDPSKDDYSWSGAFPDAQTAFAAGDLALYIGYASEEAQIQKTNPNLDFAVAPVPQIRGGGSVDVARVYGLAISRTGKDPGAAATAAYLLTSEASSQAFAAALGLPSARRDALATPAQDQAELFRQQALITHSWTDPNPDQTSQIFRAMIDDTTSGALSVTDALSRADAQMGALLQPAQ